MGPGAADWDDQTELLAATVDWLGHIDYLLQKAHFKGSPKPPPPVPRPGADPAVDDPVDEGDELPATLEDAAAYFRAQRDD